MHESIKSHNENSEGNKFVSMLRVARVVSLLAALVLLAGSVASPARASPLLRHDRASPNEERSTVVVPAGIQDASRPKQKSNIEDLDNLLLSIMDSVKRDKLHSIKQTLRFGRSDPSMAPSSFSHDDLDNGSNNVRPAADPFADYDRRYH